MNGINKLCLISILFITSKTISQTCPANIGFEDGTLNNWSCSAGTVARDGSLSLSPTLPIPGRHTIISNTGATDPYGGFPILCPNGSGYSLQLGNSSAGGEAEGVSYTFTIPANNNDYSLIYNYAVVFENPNHLPSEQPRFVSKIYNVTDNSYIECGSFEFVASSNLPGFKDAGGSVFYKPWSPVTVNLSGYAGKKVRLEFTTNDCAFVRHFGYAYLDVNEDCSSSPITGNTFCGAQQSVTLTAPFGFASYNWYTSNFSQILGTNNTITFSPPPADNTVYALEVIPYQGLGCKDTLYTTIHLSPDPYKLVVKNQISGCASPGVDITDPSVTAGSTPGLKFSYFMDMTQMNYVVNPNAIIASGTYYIKGVNSSGCNDIKPIVVTVTNFPQLIITNPEGVCMPLTVDITNSSVTAGSETDLAYSYWKNITATQPLPNAVAINTTGTYYIKGYNSTTGCGIVKPVDVKIGAIPKVLITDAVGCGVADITKSFITFGSDPGLSYTYWNDAAASIILPQPNLIKNTGKYFIKATSNSGCAIVKPVNVTINPFPVFTVTDPKTVSYPVTTVDITKSVVLVANLKYSFWFDSLTTKILSNPTTVDKRGTYYIKGTNQFGCSSINAVNVKIVPSANPVLFAPNAFTPNSDELNDTYKLKVLGEITINHFRIYNRWGQVVYETSNLSKGWDGKFKGLEQGAGVYVWMLDGYDEYYQKSVNAKGLITLIR